MRLIQDYEAWTETVREIASKKVLVYIFNLSYLVAMEKLEVLVLHMQIF